MNRAFLVFFCILICLIDIKTRRIPDTLLALWLLYMLFSDLYTKNTASAEHIAAGTALFLLFFLLFSLTSGTLGFGDVKLAGVLAYALNLDQTLVMCLFSAFLCLIVYAVGILCYHWEKSVKIPFAPFLGAGALMAVFLC
ncbi:MAG: A24 family peptidase [Treponema sp.]|jgi:Flp pilus assembly protein protease CpaA|nr:A24 family peptidase [Treponema sp.]